jgi:asparagine synthase (glutamine-hydrolysing)
MLRGQANPDQPIADAMCRQMVHRGPDDQGVFMHPLGQIGMRRLAIIDLSTGHQPIHNEDRSIWIVFNGEIYNFRELRTELQQLGHTFYTDSDTECIVHAYEAFGDDCFKRLRGMFAIAILDLRRQRLVLARDRLGKKPLYHTTLADGTLAFASELKCLMPVPGFRAQARPSPTAIRDFFALGYIPAPQTIYEGVHKLPPAHVLVAEGGRTTMHRYWEPVFDPKWTDDEPTLKARLAHELEDAVRARLVSDVPFGAFLSGGIDSSVVATLMARNMSQPVKTFSIGFREDAFNELPAARAVAQHIGADHHELVVEADAVSLMNDLVWHFDEPFGDSSAIPTYLVSKLAASHVKMVLSGDGGDELFAGYERYRRYQALQQMQRRSLGLAGPALRAAGALMPGLAGTRMSRIADRLAQPYPDNYLSGVALATQADLRQLLRPEVAGSDPFASVRHHFEGHASMQEPFERILAGDMATYLADDILVKVDRMTMATSLEARAPLLDHQLFEFAARLPFDMKLRGNTGKYLLKQVAQDLLPASVMNKPKQGFAIPVARWLRNELRPLLQDLIGSRSFRERGLFQQAGVQQCFDRHLAGTHDMSEPLWLLLTYELWARRFLDEVPAAAAPARSAQRAEVTLP